MSMIYLATNGCVVTRNELSRRICCQREAITRNLCKKVRFIINRSNYHGSLLTAMGLPAIEK